MDLKASSSTSCSLSDTCRKYTRVDGYSDGDAGVPLLIMDRGNELESVRESENCVTVLRQQNNSEFGLRTTVRSMILQLLHMYVPRLDERYGKRENGIFHTKETICHTTSETPDSYKPVCGSRSVKYHTH